MPMIAINLSDAEASELERLATVLSRLLGHPTMPARADALAAALIRLSMASPSLADDLLEYLEGGAA